MPAKRRAPKRDALIAPEILSPRSRSACIGQYWVSSALPGHWKFSRACRPAGGSEYYQTSYPHALRLREILMKEIRRSGGMH